MQEENDNISREMGILEINKKEMLKNTKVVTEMKDSIDGLINRLDLAKERIYQLDDRSKVLKLKWFIYITLIWTIYLIAFIEHSI